MTQRTVGQSLGFMGTAIGLFIFWVITSLAAYGLGYYQGISHGGRIEWNSRPQPDFDLPPWVRRQGP